MTLSIDNIIQIAAFFTGISSLIVLIYLSFLSTHKAARLGLWVVFFHALNYIMGIVFSLNNSMGLAVINTLAGFQLLTVPLLLYSVMRLIEALGKVPYRIFYTAGRGLLFILTVVEIIFFASSFSHPLLSLIISVLIMIFALYLWVYLFSMKTVNDLSSRIRLTGLIGYSLIIPWMFIERIVPRTRQIHPADAVSFLFLTIAALIFSIRYMVNSSSSSEDDGPSLVDVQMRFGLTDRETEVLQLLAQSCSYKEIASSLGISMATVKTHVSRVYKKTETSGRSELKYRFREPK